MGVASDVFWMMYFFRDIVPLSILHTLAFRGPWRLLVTSINIFPLTLHAEFSIQSHYLDLWVVPFHQHYVLKTHLFILLLTVLLLQLHSSSLLGGRSPSRGTVPFSVGVSYNPCPCHVSSSVEVERTYLSDPVPGSPLTLHQLPECEQI